MNNKIPVSQATHRSEWASLDELNALRAALLQAAEDADQAAYLAEWSKAHPHKSHRRPTRQEVAIVALIFAAALAWWGWPALMRWIYPWW